MQRERSHDELRRTQWICAVAIGVTVGCGASVADGGRSDAGAGAGPPDASLAAASGGSADTATGGSAERGIGGVQVMEARTRNGGGGSSGAGGADDILLAAWGPSSEAGANNAEQNVDSSDLGLEAEPVVALAVFDKSGSMGGGWTVSDAAGSDQAVTKWVAASDALVGAITPIVDRVTAAALFFPQPSECAVASLQDEQQIGFLPGPQFLDAWRAAAESNGPTGSTPLGTALAVADEALEAARGQGLLDRRTVVLLFTDGEPNCDTNVETVVEWPARWLGQGISTYVFGLPGSAQADAILNALASAGGTQARMAPGTPQELESGVAAAL